MMERVGVGLILIICGAAGMLDALDQPSVQGLQVAICGFITGFGVWLTRSVW